MFKHQPTLEILNAINKNTLGETLAIEFIEAGEDYIVAKMPVDKRTHQPAGLLHGGASVALAETLGSVAGFLCLDDIKTQQIVGLEINANHIRGVREGFVYGRVSPLHVGRTTQVWEIKITNEEGKLVCVSRLTVAVIDRSGK
jgi:1,4-dihydroxy-2-naphthoyl-CoA hydrolase